ncbi:MAG TPA: hypothetical protein VMW30_07925 [Candidatus Paceibacterota bacterium]|nr:hypothetical protein [Candidatus Paceibacterota bacterium]
MNLSQLRSQWSNVLNLLEKEDRIAWLAFFDARLARLENQTLYLDFSDSRKFSGSLEYGQIRDSHRIALQEAIKTTLGVALEVVDR